MSSRLEEAPIKGNYSMVNALKQPPESGTNLVIQSGSSEVEGDINVQGV
jgi:hypothetical protein